MTPQAIQSMAPAIGFFSEAEGKSLLLKTLHTQITGLGLLGVHPVVKENNRKGNT